MSNNMIDLQSMEGRTDMESNLMDTALEQFFNNVLECVIIDESVFCVQEQFFAKNKSRLEIFFVLG